MSAAEISVVIVAVTGLLAAAPAIIKEIRAIRSGRAIAEKQRNRSAIGRVAEMEDDLEAEISFRRRLQEYITELRRLLIQMGYPEEKLPTEPARHKAMS